MNDAILEIQELTFAFEQKSLFNGLNLKMNKGEITALIGISGAGKTTLFKLITGMLPLQNGAVVLRGDVSYMTQEDLLLPWRTVFQNVVLPLELGQARISDNNLDFEQANKLLRFMGLGDYSQHYPQQLSGGMRQRVSLARALIRNTPILLLDEPFISLDLFVKENLYSLLQSIKVELDTSILFITHDFRDALTVADRILLLSKGRIYKEWKDIKNTPVSQSELRAALYELNQNL